MRGWALSTSYPVISLLLLLDVNCCCKSKVHVLEQQEGCAHFTFTKDKGSEILKVQWEQKKKKSFIVQVTFVLLIRLPGDLTSRSELWMKCCVCRASEQQIAHLKFTSFSTDMSLEGLRCETTLHCHNQSRVLVFTYKIDSSWWFTDCNSWAACLRN